MARFEMKLKVEEQLCSEINDNHVNEVNVLSIGGGLVYLTVQGCVVHHGDTTQILTILNREEVKKLMVYLKAASEFGVVDDDSFATDDAITDALISGLEVMRQGWSDTLSAMVGAGKAMDSSDEAGLLS